MLQLPTSLVCSTCMLTCAPLPSLPLVAAGHSRGAAEQQGGQHSPPPPPPPRFPPKDVFQPPDLHGMARAYPNLERCDVVIQVEWRQKIRKLCTAQQPQQHQQGRHVGTIEGLNRFTYVGAVIPTGRYSDVRMRRLLVLFGPT
jgi:hypothetical protein